MKILADACLARHTVERLRQEGHDVRWPREEGRPMLLDEELLEMARDDERVFVTFDLGVGSLLAGSGRATTPSVVSVRVTDQRPASITPLLLEALEQEASALNAGAIVVVEEHACRVRRLPFP